MANTDKDALTCPNSSPIDLSSFSSEDKAALLNKLLAEEDYASLNPEEIQILIEHLQTLQRQAQKRSFWGKALAGINGFVDGVYDIVALSAVGGTIAAIVAGVAIGAALITPPVGWILLAVIGTIALGNGTLSAVDAVGKKSNEQKEHQKKLQEAINRLTVLKKLKEISLKSPPPYIDENYLDHHYKAYEENILSNTLFASLKEIYSFLKTQLKSNSRGIFLERLKKKYGAYKARDSADPSLENSETSSESVESKKQPQAPPIR